MNDALQQLLDARALEQHLIAYFERIDANDPEGASAFLAEDVEFEIMTGRHFQGRERFARKVARVVDAYAATSHHISNFTCTIDGDTATSSCYVYAFHRMAATGDTWHLWVRIENRYARTAGGWTITEHVLRGVDSQPRRDDIPPEWYAGHRGRLAREPVPRRPA